jgi:hypothetical protein
MRTPSRLAAAGLGVAAALGMLTLAAGLTGTGVGPAARPLSNPTVTSTTVVTSTGVEPPGRPSSSSTVTSTTAVTLPRPRLRDQSPFWSMPEDGAADPSRGVRSLCCVHEAAEPANVAALPALVIGVGEHHPHVRVREVGFTENP